MHRFKTTNNLSNMDDIKYSYGVNLYDARTQRSHRECAPFRCWKMWVSVCFCAMAFSIRKTFDFGSFAEKYNLHMNFLSAIVFLLLTQLEYEIARLVSLWSQHGIHNTNDESDERQPLLLPWFLHGTVWWYTCLFSFPFDGITCRLLCIRSWLMVVLKLMPLLLWRLPLTFYSSQKPHLHDGRKNRFIWALANSFVRIELFNWMQIG